MSNVSDILNSNDPDQLQALYNQLFGKQTTQDAVDSQSLPGNSAQGSADALSGVDPDATTAEEYNKLFGKQATQDLVDSQAVPGKTAADSADVFKQALGEGVDDSKALVHSGERSLVPAGEKALAQLGERGLVPASESGTLAALGDSAGVIAGGASKALGPLAALTGLYGGEAGAAGLSDVPGAKSPKEQAQLLAALQASRGTASSNGSIPVPAQYVPGVSNPGPVATTGFNPNNPINGPTIPADMLAQRQSDASDDDEHDSTPVPKSPSKASPSSDDESPDAEVQSTATLADLESKAQPQAQANDPSQLYSQQALQDAQGGFKQKAMQFLGGLAYGDNPAALNAYMANSPVAKLKAQQEQANANNAFQLQQYKVADEKDKNDVNSPSSQFARNSVMAIAKQAGIALPTSFNQMSASSIESNPILDKMLTAQSNNLTKQMLAQQRLSQMQQTQGLKEGQQQNQALQQTTQMLESARGNPAAAQAEKDLYAAQKLNSLVGNGQNLSPEMTQLAASEVAKIAQGGVPTSEELKGLKPNTIPSKLATLAEQVQNQPVGANAQAFLKQYKDYADKLSGDAQKVITDKYGRIIETNKGRLGDDNYKALQDNYINRFNQPTRAPQSQQLSPQDQQAIQWAQANPNDPRAKQILALHGVQ